ncbi:MAG: AraC family transcriptional regulator [Cyanobacteria bacterium P01_A01_bin.83]
MTNILVKDEHSETINFLIELLNTAGFEVISVQKNLVNVQFAPGEISTNTEIKKSNTAQTIFPSIPRLREVFEFIELNYHQNIRLKEVAQAVGYSSAYLTDLVRKLTGKTVNNWIIERRIAEASNLLLETDYSIEQIAFKVGYQNINHFYCQFRNYYQNTPKGWREEKRCQLTIN